MHIFISVCMQLHLDPFDWVQVQAFIIKSLKLTKAEICVWNLFSTFVKDFFFLNLVTGDLLVILLKPQT